ncbi:MAG: alpha/beta hydrolase [Enterococcus sp.]
MVFFYIHYSRRMAKKLIHAGLDRQNNWYQKKGHRLMDPDIFTQSIETNELEAEAFFWKLGTVWTVQSQEGLHLQGKVFRQKESEEKWVICLHGYRDSGRDVALIGEEYWNRGFNVLIPDLRAHGESEGQIIGMGWLDRADLSKWLEKILADTPDAKIIFHGVSMGATASMMISGEKLPEQVKGFIADSGFVSVYAQFDYMLSKLTKFPKRAILREANKYAKKVAGYSLKQASATRQLGSNHLPLLVIHGSEDKLVPTREAYTAIEATAGEKELCLLEGSVHLAGSTHEITVYWDRVTKFLDKIM